jgi:hypothetical protein
VLESVVPELPDPMLHCRRTAAIPEQMFYSLLAVGAKSGTQHLTLKTTSQPALETLGSS